MKDEVTRPAAEVVKTLLELVLLGFDVLMAKQVIGAAELGEALARMQNQATEKQQEDVAGLLEFVAVQVRREGWRGLLDGAPAGTA